MHPALQEARAAPKSVLQSRVHAQPSHRHPHQWSFCAGPAVQSVFDFVDVQSGTESGAIEGSAAAAAGPAGDGGGAAPAIQPGAYSLATSYPRRILQARGCLLGRQLGALSLRLQMLLRIPFHEQFAGSSAGPGRAAHTLPGMPHAGCCDPLLQDGSAAAGLTLEEAGITSKQEALFLEPK